MKLFDTIKGGIANHFDKLKRRREEVEQIQREADLEANEIFRQQFKKDSLEVAKKKAYIDSARLSGIQKLRATNRAMRLGENNQPPTSFLGKVSEYTRKNLAKREQNLERTRKMREEAEKIRQQKQEERLVERQKRMATTGGFGQCSWKL